MAIPSRYLNIGLLGELTEPWRVENDLKPQAQAHLDIAAVCLRIISPHRLTVADAYSLYTDRLCEAIDINLGNLVVSPAHVPSPIWIDYINDYPEMRDVH